MLIPPITNSDVNEAIQSVIKKIHTDEIDADIIKENRECFAVPLTIIFNQPIRTEWCVS